MKILQIVVVLSILLMAATVCYAQLTCNARIGDTSGGWIECAIGAGECSSQQKCEDDTCYAPAGPPGSGCVQHYGSVEHCVPKFFFCMTDPCGEVGCP